MEAPGRRRWIGALRVATAAVWIVFGLGFKVLGWVPRHRRIVAAVLGSTLAGPGTMIIGVAEAAMGIWILGGWRPRTCAAAQTLAIVTMNALEIAMARSLLLAPIGMVCANLVLLTAGWWIALQPRAGAA